MDEDISIINSNTRNEKIKNFFINNKKKLFSIVLIVILSLISFFGYKEFNERNHISISNQYNSAVIEFSEDKKINAVNKFIDIINKKDPTYSTLSLYFLIDNKLIADNKKINELFDIILEETINKNLANDIDLTKTDKLLKIILFAAIFELMFKHNIPTKVVISEYLSASEYFLEKIQIGYLNAILDKISKQIRK